MTFFILVIAILFEGEIHIFHYGTDEPFPCPALETCESKLAQEEADEWGGVLGFVIGVLICVAMIFAFL